MQSLRCFRQVAGSRNLSLKRQFVLAALGSCAASTLVLAFFANTSATAGEQGAKAEAGEGKVLFNLEMKSLDGQRIRLEDPEKWKIDNGTLYYINPGHLVSRAAFETDQRDYQFDAEITIDPEAERKAGVGASSQKRVGVFFRKSGSKEAAFFTMYRCIKTSGIEQWTACGILSVLNERAGRPSITMVCGPTENFP